MFYYLAADLWRVFTFDYYDNLVLKSTQNEQTNIEILIQQIKKYSVEGT